MIKKLFRLEYPFAGCSGKSEIVEFENGTSDIEIYDSFIDWALEKVDAWIENVEQEDGKND